MRDGWHDVRVVAVARNLLETRAYKALPVTVDNRGAKLKVAANAGKVAFGEAIRMVIIRDRAAASLAHLLKWSPPKWSETRP